MAVRASWNGVVVAEAADEDIKIVEGHVYFPPDAVRRDLLADSRRHTRCYWKGKASYYHLDVGGRQNSDAAWYYPRPWPLARHLKNYVAFWRGVRVERTPDGS